VVDFPALLARTQAIVSQLHEKKDLLGHLNRSGVVVLSQVGKVTFADPHHIQLGSGQHLGAEQFIICAGGHARRLDFPGAEHTLTHSDIWELDALPRKVAIVGGSATGCQLASILNAFGATVSLLETASRPLPTEDGLIAQTLVEAFERRGISIVVNLTRVNRVERSEHGLELAYSDADGEHRLTADAVVQAVGWPGNTDSLNLEAAGVEAERSYIKVDHTLRTSQPHIFAAGDITGRMMLVQGATDEARAAAQNAVLGRRRVHEHRVVPHGGFTDPEYGSVGMTEAQASEQHDVTVATVPYADLDRALIDSRSEGWCKLIVSRETHAILGAHVVGEQAVEIVHLVAALMQAHSTIERLAQLEIAYPTFAAIVGLAARQITRELSALPIAMPWGVTNQLNAAEWERNATNTALPIPSEDDGTTDAGAP
jgi:pyruvate/2-oxoglutarate dehydrogenase complex dihydrolipoamide dehydrogenase (E3) component